MVIQTSMESALKLILLITGSCLLNIVAARECTSQNGEETIECDDDEACCEVNGDLDCCDAGDLWWLWVMLAIFIIVGIIICCCVCYCCHKHGMCNFSPTPVQVVQHVPKTEAVGMQPQVRQPQARLSVNIAEPPPNTYGGEIKLKSFDHGYADSFSSTKCSDLPPTYTDTGV